MVDIPLSIFLPKNTRYDIYEDYILMEHMNSANVLTCIFENRLRGKTKRFISILKNIECCQKIV